MANGDPYIQFASGMPVLYDPIEYEALTGFDENGAVWTPLTEIECV
jgi:hypothetical protein